MNHHQPQWPLRLMNDGQCPCADTGDDEDRGDDKDMGDDEDAGDDKDTGDDELR